MAFIRSILKTFSLSLSLQEGLVDLSQHVFAGCKPTVHLSSLQCLEELFYAWKEGFTSVILQTNSKFIQDYTEGNHTPGEQELNF